MAIAHETSKKTCSIWNYDGRAQVIRTFCSQNIAPGDQCMFVIKMSLESHNIDGRF